MKRVYWRSVIAALIVALTLGLGCDKGQHAADDNPSDNSQRTNETEFDMNVTHARIFETNASLPPQYQSEDEWILRASDVPDWKSVIDGVLDGTSVNGVMTVREHARLLAINDTAALKDLEPDSDERLPEPTGAPSITFTLNDGESVVYRFRSDYTYSGEGFTAFKELVQSKGTHTQNKPGERAPESETD